MSRKKHNPHVGSDFEDFLAEEGQIEGATAVAIKRVVAWQIAQAMKDEKVSQAELARRMKTSRAVIHRLLDADDPERVNSVSPLEALAVIFGSLEAVVLVRSSSPRPDVRGRGQTVHADRR